MPTDARGRGGTTAGLEGDGLPPGGEKGAGEGDGGKGPGPDVVLVFWLDIGEIGGKELWRGGRDGAGAGAWDVGEAVEVEAPEGGEEWD